MNPNPNNLKMGIESHLQMFIAFWAMNPSLFPDGEKWCCLYKTSVQSDIAGFGETPIAAMQDFYNRLFTEKAKFDKDAAVYVYR